MPYIYPHWPNPCHANKPFPWSGPSHISSTINHLNRIPYHITTWWCSCHLLTQILDSGHCVSKTYIICLSVSYLFILMAQANWIILLDSQKVNSFIGISIQIISPATKSFAQRLCPAAGIITFALSFRPQSSSRLFLLNLLLFYIHSPFQRSD